MSYTIHNVKYSFITNTQNYVYFPKTKSGRNLKEIEQIIKVLKLRKTKG